LKEEEKKRKGVEEKRKRGEKLFLFVSPLLFYSSSLPLLF